MKAISIQEYGNPAQVANVVELTMDDHIGANQIEIGLVYAPINPSDLLFVMGRYGLRPQLPHVAGFEGVAEVLKVGQDVKHINVGDNVLYPADGQSYSTRRVVPADALFPLPKADLQQLSMLQINPVTAYAMLTEFTTLNKGDWVVQSGANSGVGRAVIAIAKERGYRTLNVVRRKELVAELKALGADEVVVGIEELQQKHKDILGEQGAKLALDAVGSDMFSALSECLGLDGTLVTFGVISGEGGDFFTGPTIFKNLTIKGFWLVPWLEKQPKEKLKAITLALADMVAKGKIFTPIEKVYPLDDAAKAFTHAMNSQGKILFEHIEHWHNVED